MNGPGSSVESGRLRAAVLAAGAALFAWVIWRDGERWMDARAAVAGGAMAWGALAAIQAGKPSARWSGAMRVLGVSVVMLVAASWRSAGWIVWAGVALAAVGLDAARSREDDRMLAPSAMGAAVCVAWNAWRYGVPPLRVFGFAACAGLLAASVRGRWIKR